MRTTLDIADDVLLAVKERAKRKRKTAGQLNSELVRQALTVPQPSGVRAPKAMHGFRPFARRGSIITNELIDQLRTDDVY
jgi:hypothetical protein